MQTEPTLPSHRDSLGAMLHGTIVLAIIITLSSDAMSREMIVLIPTAIAEAHASYHCWKRNYITVPSSTDQDEEPVSDDDMTIS
jgi:hypothetical protein